MSNSTHKSKWHRDWTGRFYTIHARYQRTVRQTDRPTERKQISTFKPLILHWVSKNDTDVPHYNFIAHQPILVIFGTDAAKGVCHQMVICYSTSPNSCLCTTWGNIKPEIASFQSGHVSKRCCFGLLYLRLLSTNCNNFWHALSTKFVL